MLIKAAFFSLKGWALIILVAVSGCVAYHPMPLTDEAVRAGLRPPDMVELRIPAREINHPILHPVVLNPDQGLSPDGAAILAVLLNPSLRVIRDQRAVSRAQLLDAGLLPNPELTAGLDVATGGGTAGKVIAYGLGLNWEVTSLLSRAAGIGGAKARDEAVALDIAWKEWLVAQAARAAVYQLTALENQLIPAEQIRQHLVQNLAQIRKAVADGSMTANVLSAAQEAGRQANENLLNLKKQAAQQRLQLMRLMGLPQATKIRLNNDIRLPSRIELPDDMTLFEGLEKRRLDLLALRRGYESQEAAVRKAVMQQFPRIVIGPTISRDTDSLQTTGFSLSLELPIFNRNQGKIAGAEATRKKLFDEYASRVFEAHSDIELLLSGIRFTNEQIALARTAESDLARLVDNTRAAFADGRIDARVYYTAFNDLISARMKVVALQGQLSQAVAALEFASGFYELPRSGRSTKRRN